MSYQRGFRQPSGKRGRRVDDDEFEGQGRGRGPRRRTVGAWDEDAVEWEVSEWSGVLYTDRIRNVARLR